jgi:UDP-GlcNAc3NAcA epimerase
LTFPEQDVPKAAHPNSAIRLVSVVGARPQFVKAFPFSKAVRETPGLEEIMIHTGQHFDANMSEVFFRELGIAPPAYHFDIHGGHHGAMTARMLTAIEEVLLKEQPDAVLIYGDTNSTLAGALAAAKLQIPVVHVEAGLRSYNRAMPEEINRVMADHLSAVLLCPTTTAIENLIKEGIHNGVHNVGDLMFDATVMATELAKRHATVLNDLNLKPKSYGVATVHRAENTDEPQNLARIARYLSEHAQEHPLVLPLHPRTRAAAKAAGIEFGGGVRLVEPLGYLDMCQLVNGANIVFTDSGGLQKEAYFHRVPCVTLRSETEWVETVEAGWNRLWMVKDYKPRRDIAEYGDGHSAQKIVAILRETLKHRSEHRTA